MEAPGRLATEYLLRLDAEFEQPQTIDAGPLGTRRILVMKSGRCTGPTVSGQVLPGGADWVLVRADGVSQLDIRLTVRTDDGALIFVNSWGLFDIAESKRELLRRGEALPGDYYFRTMLRFETGAVRFRWLNRIIAAGVGTRTPTGMSTDVYSLT
jgi:hypothetical protein